MIVTVLGTAAGNDALTATSSFLIDANTLLDCGSGVETLAVDSQLAIERVLLSHAHFDHVCGLPALLACHAEHGGPGLTLHGQQDTIDEIVAGILAEPANHGYLEAKTTDGRPLIRFEPLEVGDTIPLPDGLATALPAQHRIAAIGWVIEGPWRALAYSGDTGPCPAFWHWAANVPSLSDVICELTYATANAERAKAEGHMTPGALLGLLEVIPPNVQIWIHHIDRGERDHVLAEITRAAPSSLNIGEIKPGTVIDL